MLGRRSFNLRVKGRDGARGRAPSVAAGVVLLAFSLGVPGGEAAWPPPFSSVSTSASGHELELFWSDHYELLRKKLPGWGRASLNNHVENLFREIGVHVRWLETFPENDRTSGPVAVRIVLVPLSGEGWRLPRNVMGVVMDKSQLTRTLYVFLPSVLHSIGDETGTATLLRDPRRVRDLARALACVVTHEVVHAIDPDIPHSTTDSIMKDHLTPELLRRDDLRFSGSTMSRLVAAIARPKGTLPP